jgi:hypothetical protein
MTDLITQLWSALRDAGLPLPLERHLVGRHDEGGALGGSGPENRPDYADC